MVRPGVLGAAAAGVRFPEAPCAVDIAALLAISRRPIVLAFHTRRLFFGLFSFFVG